MPVSVPKSFLTLLGAVPLLAVLAPIVYVLCGPFLDGRARGRAENTCNAVQVGAAVDHLMAIAKENNVELLEWPLDKDGGAHYQFWFSGFLANGFTCEVYAESGKVRSRFTDEHTW